MLLLLIACNNQQQEPELTLSGKVVGVADGDTFTLLLLNNTTKKIRLHGVDAPERGQAFGTVSRQRLSELVFQKGVSVVQTDTDQYGRVVGIARVEGLVVNEEMLRSGLVWHYTEYDENPLWAELEREARRKRVGLWSERAPVAPWEWRRAQREARKRAA